MSIEQALAENTAAIKELIAMWGKLNAQAKTVDKAPAETTVTAAGKPVEAKVEKAGEKPKAEKPAAVEKDKAESKPKAEAPVADYAPVGAAITAFAAANGRDATLAKLAEFGVTSGKALKPEQYADVLAAFTATEEVA